MWIGALIHKTRRHSLVCVTIPFLLFAADGIPVHSVALLHDRDVLFASTEDDPFYGDTPKPLVWRICIEMAPYPAQWRANARMKATEFRLLVYLLWALLTKVLTLANSPWGCKWCKGAFKNSIDLNRETSNLLAFWNKASKKRGLFDVVVLHPLKWFVKHADYKKFFLKVEWNESVPWKCKGRSIFVWYPLPNARRSQCLDC